MNLKKALGIVPLLLLNLLVLNLIIGSSMLIAAKLSWGLAIVNSVFISLLVLFLGFWYRQLSLGWTVLVAITGTIISGMYIADFYDVKDGVIVDSIRIEEALNYPEADGFVFTNGRVETSLAVTHYVEHLDHNNNLKTSSYYAAPIVSEDWTVDKPVGLFAVAAADAQKKNWSKPYRAAIKASVSFREELEEAARKCLSENNLKAAEGYRLVRWVEDPQQAIAAIYADFSNTWLLWNYVTGAGIFLIWLIGLVRGRKKAVPEQTDSNTVAEAPERNSVNLLIRVLFSFYLFYILMFSVFLSGIDFSDIFLTLLIIVAVVFYIISQAAFHNAHVYARRSMTELALVFIYPYLAYTVIFFSLDPAEAHFWIFTGFFYFLMISGGFVFGIFLTHWHLRQSITYRDALEPEESGALKNSRKKPLVSLSLMLVMLFIAFSIAFLYLYNYVNQVKSHNIPLFYLFLSASIAYLAIFIKNDSLQRKRARHFKS